MRYIIIYFKIIILITQRLRRGQKSTLDVRNKEVYRTQQGTPSTRPPKQEPRTSLVRLRESASLIGWRPCHWTSLARNTRRRARALVTEGCLDSCSYEASLWDFVNNYHYVSGAHEGTFTRKALGMCAACFQSFFNFQFGQVFISNKAKKKVHRQLFNPI